METIRLLYGREGLAVRVGESAAVLEGKAPPAIHQIVAVCTMSMAAQRFKKMPADESPSSCD